MWRARLIAAFVIGDKPRSDDDLVVERFETLDRHVVEGELPLSRIRARYRWPRRKR